MEKVMNTENESTLVDPMELNSPDDPIGRRGGCSPDSSWQWRCGDFSAHDSWSPAVNVYQMSRRVEVCIDLSGINASKVDLQVQTGALLIRGVRLAPDPRKTTGESCRILSMEIAHGPFCREVVIPEHIDTNRIMTRYAGGYLWVTLPMRSQG